MTLLQTEKTIEFQLFHSYFNSLLAWPTLIEPSRNIFLNYKLICTPKKNNAKDLMFNLAQKRNEKKKAMKEIGEAG